MESAPQDIPAGGLLRLAESLTKLEMARLEKAPTAVAAAPTVLEMVQKSTLPPERKRELLADELSRWGDYHSKLMEAQAELEET
jgi:hypothetical protein